MGNRYCQSLTLENNNEDTARLGGTLRTDDSLDLLPPQSTHDEASPLKVFILKHSSSSVKGASNGLRFAPSAPQPSPDPTLQNETPFGVKFESVKMVQPWREKQKSKRCSIVAEIKGFGTGKSTGTTHLKASTESSEVEQAEASVSRQSERRKRDSFSKIEIGQQKFIQLRRQDPRLHYQFQKIIGEGAYGSVYRAKSLRSQQLRAIKIIKKENLGRSKKDEVFAELELLKKMDHPNIIKLYEVYEWDNRYQVVMEFCQGGSFIDFIKARKAFDETIIKVILKQLLGCLNYLKTLHIVHRDLKLENVVFIQKPEKGEEIEIKLLDFGTAYRLHKPKVRCTELIGTISYMPPEIIKGYFTEACDLWSCGVIFYILLTSKSPFRCRKKEDTLEKILNHELKFTDDMWKGVSEQAKDLLRRLLDKDPASRITASDALRHPWFQNERRNSGQRNSNFLGELSGYYRRNNLISVLESYLVFSRANQEERKRVNAIFQELDKNQDGHIEKKELVQAFRENDPEGYDPALVEAVLARLDKDESGMITLSEFTSAMVNKDTLWARTALEEAFDYFDSDKTGFIEKHELEEILGGAHVQEVQVMLLDLDSDHDQKISRPQFVDYFLRQGCLH